MGAAEFRERAIRLLAMALKARDNGDTEYSDQLTVHAAELFERAETLEAAQPSEQAARRPMQPQRQAQRDSDDNE